MRGTSLRIELSGPFFERDVKKTFRENARSMLAAMVAEGVIPIRQELNAHRSSKQHPHAADGLRAELHSISGKPWVISAAIHQYTVYPWGDAAKTASSTRMQAQYKGGKLEARIHIFRRVYLALRRSRKITQANLVKGLN